MSPHAIFKAEKSKYAPNFAGLSLINKPFESVGFVSSRKATLIAIFSTQMAMRMCKPYLETVETAFPSNPSVGTIRLQFEENWMKWAIIRYYLKSKYLAPLYAPQQQVCL